MAEVAVRFDRIGAALSAGLAAGMGQSRDGVLYCPSRVDAAALYRLGERLGLTVKIANPNPMPHVRIPLVTAERLFWASIACSAVDMLTGPFGVLHQISVVLWLAGAYRLGQQVGARRRARRRS